MRYEWEEANSIMDDVILWLCVGIFIVCVPWITYKLTIEHLTDDCWYQGYFEYEGVYYHCLADGDEPK